MCLTEGILLDISMCNLRYKLDLYMIYIETTPTTKWDVFFCLATENYCEVV